MDKACFLCKDQSIPGDTTCFKCKVKVHLVCLPVKQAPPRGKPYTCAQCNGESATGGPDDTTFIPPSESTSLGVEGALQREHDRVLFLEDRLSTVMQQVKARDEKLADQESSTQRERDRMLALENMVSSLKEQTKVQDALLAQRDAQFESLVKRLQVQDKVQTPGNGSETSTSNGVTQGDNPSPQHRNLTFGQNINNNDSSHLSNDLSLDASLWRSRLPEQFVESALATRPLTKDQLARRKLGTTLPEFNGNAFVWLKFIKKFLETSGDMCGFTPSDDLERVGTALKGRALALVGEYLENPDNLDVVMNSLHQNFGQSWILIEAAYDKVSNMTPLNKDLSNLSQFAGEVDQIRIIANLEPTNPMCTTIVKQLERKLSNDYAELWLDIRGMHEVGTVNQMADFLLARQARRISLHRGQPEKVTRKPVLAVRELPYEESMDSKSDRSSAKSRSPPAQEDLPTPIASAPVPPQPAFRQSCKLKCKQDHAWIACPRFKKLSVKLRWRATKRYKLCVACLCRHDHGECKAQANCNVDGCVQKHHPLLHPVGVRVENTMNLATTPSKSTYYRILTVVVRYGQESKTVSCLMDSGSSVTLIDERLAKDLGMDGETLRMALTWADGMLQPIRDAKAVSFSLQNPLTGEEYELNAKTYRKLTLPQNRLTREILASEKLDHLPFDCSFKGRPLFLIGQDNCFVTRTLRSELGSSNRVFASETPLGYTFEGELGGRPRTQQRRGAREDLLDSAKTQEEEEVCLSIFTDRRMEKMMTDYINDDHFGLAPDETILVESDEYMRARAMMEANTVQRADGHFETGLLWTNDDIKLCDNYAAVKRRHLNWEKNLWKEPEKQDKVNTVMRSYLAKRYIRPVASPGTTDRVWYVPIFTVSHPAKPEKTRPVFDCAAAFNQVSLNSVLVSGPDLTRPLIHVLQRFRVGKFAVSADLEKMFHQVGVREAELLQRVLDVRRIHAAGRFNMHKFLANSEAILNGVGVQAGSEKG